MQTLTRSTVCLAVLLTVSAAFADPKPAASSSLNIFQQRILPILQAKNPSSCTECHLSGVELKQYILPDQADTFAALRRDGLVDVENPDKSKILEFIRRAPKTGPLIGPKVRQLELEAFEAWIRAASSDPQLVAAKTDELIGPQLPEEVIRHARQDHVLDAFIDNVWSEVGRCAACHSPDRNQQQVKKHGERVSWIRLKDPQATLALLKDHELIDVESPEDSLLLLKPTNQVDHGGGVKMEIGDRTYKQFRRFLEDYAAIVRGRYKSAEELPQPSQEVSAVSEIWLKLSDIPEAYHDLVLQADVFRAERGGWSKTRWATGDRRVFGKGKLWQQHLSITAPRESPRAAEIRRQPTLPAGKYLVRIYVDRGKALEKDYTAVLGNDDIVGEVEIETNWSPGYGAMTTTGFPGK